MSQLNKYMFKPLNPYIYILTYMYLSPRINQSLKRNTKSNEIKNCDEKNGKIRGALRK